MNAHRAFVDRQKGIMKHVSTACLAGFADACGGCCWGGNCRGTCSFVAAAPVGSEGGQLSGGTCSLLCFAHLANPSSQPYHCPPQVPDFDPEESVYKTRWMPPAKRVGAWA